MNKNQNPQKLIQETKKFLHRSAKTLKSLYKNLPKTSRSDNSKKLLHNICMKNDVIDQEKCSKKTSLTASTTVDPNLHSKSKSSWESENGGGKRSFRAAEGLAKKMKLGLEMMDINDDQDHVSDIEEILHDYSQLSHPPYVEIVDKFFMDMYTEFFMGCGVHGSMRKLQVGSNSTVHGSMRSTLAPIKI